jgi:hypothetical protein
MTKTEKNQWKTWIIMRFFGKLIARKIRFLDKSIKQQELFI